MEPLKIGRIALHLILALVASGCAGPGVKVAEQARPTIEHDLTLSAGSVDRYLFESAYVDARNVDVWLPEGYSADKSYAVLYMHDGQMLFDATGSWNAQAWDVEGCIDRLGERIRDVIVVGIWHNVDKRHLEYFPQKAIDLIPEPTHSALLSLMPATPKADDYLKFITGELIPFIEATYPAGTRLQDRFIAGSSMGGLISLYAICEYPEVFAGAACLSTHWIGTFDDNDDIPAAFGAYLREHLPDPATHRIYFDHGTVGLDAFYPRHQAEIDAIMRARGYNQTNFLSLSFEGDDHNEAAWSARLAIPLEFLLGK